MQEAARHRTAITLCGSLRRDAINEILRRHLSQQLAAEGVAVSDLSLADYPMPVFNEDLEAEATPESAVRLATAFRAHDIVLIVSPEYNGGVTPLSPTRWPGSRQKPSPFRTPFSASPG